MQPNFTPLREYLKEYDVDEATTRAVTEGVWFAWRTPRRHTTLDIRNGLWWTQSGSHIVSLATGKDLHAWNTVDYETYAFKPSGVPDDICCHDTFEAAEACALASMRSGAWCHTWSEDEVASR